MNYKSQGRILYENYLVLQKILVSKPKFNVFSMIFTSSNSFSKSGHIKYKISHKETCTVSKRHSSDQIGQNRSCKIHLNGYDKSFKTSFRKLINLSAFKSYRYFRMEGHNWYRYLIKNPSRALTALDSFTRYDKNVCLELKSEYIISK